MATATVAAVQAAYVLMDREATLTKVEELLAGPDVQAADLVVFPEAFVPGTPIWIDGPPIWDGDEQWFAMLADQAVVVPSAATDRLGGSGSPSERLSGDRDRRTRADGEHDLQHAVVLRTRRHPPR
jgi:nitrilase